MGALLTRLYPTPAVQLPLAGLYLAHDLRAHARTQSPYIYSNFVLSLDGRISQPDPRTGRRLPPRAIRHPDDWRLYLELAAQADAVLISGRRWRELHSDGAPPLRCVPEVARGKLGQWRAQRGLAPHPTCIVLSESLDLPASSRDKLAEGELIVITGAKASRDRVDQLRAAGAEVVLAAAARPSGHDIHRVALSKGYTTVCSIAGPQVLYTLVAADRLDRLYLTFALRLVAGPDYDTLLRGCALVPPFTNGLDQLYFDPPRGDRPGLLFVSLDRAPPVQAVGVHKPG